MKALSLWQPMAWAAAAGYKPIENRGWPYPPALHGERFAIHASQRFDVPHATYVRDRVPCDIPAETRTGAGGVIGVATLGGLVCDADRAPGVQGHRGLLFNMGDGLPLRPCELAPEIYRWYMGPFGWLLLDVVPLREMVRCPGRQKLWDLDPEVCEAVEAQLKRRRSARRG